MAENVTFDKDKEKNSCTMNISLSAGDDKIKYYDFTDNNCIFEIIDKADDNISKDNDDVICEKVEDGKILIESIINCGEEEYLQGVKINLYKINGLSPVLIDSKVTNERGRIVFSNLCEGCYRVIEIIDKRYFEKPRYLNWNEITIDSINREQKIKILNKIKKFSASKKFR